MAAPGGTRAAPGSRSASRRPRVRDRRPLQGTRTSGLRAVGVDMAAGMLARAHTSAPLVRADALRLPLGDTSVDGAISGFAIRNVVDIAACFGEAARVIRPGGRAVFLEVSEPPNPVVRWAHALYFRRIVPMVGGLLSDRSAYRYLPASTAYLPSPDELLRAHGRCRVRPMPQAATRHGRGSTADRNQAMSAVRPASPGRQAGTETSISSSGTAKATAWCCSTGMQASRLPGELRESSWRPVRDHVRSRRGARPVRT